MNIFDKDNDYQKKFALRRMIHEEHFIEVLEKHKGILYKIANTYCKESKDRQDLIQEMIFQLWKSFTKYDDKYQYSTWIYRIALNVAISNFRKSKNSYTVLSLDAGIIDIREPEYDLDKDHHLIQLQLFISELKNMDKALILLYLEEKSYKEIADIIGISESNVGTRIGRIKTQLKDKFNSIKN